MKKLVFIFLFVISLCSAAAGDEIQNKKTLILNSEKIAALTDHHLPLLKTLTLKKSEHNPVTAIPQFDAPNLKRLSLTDSQITTIFLLNNFPNLEEVSLCNGRIDNIPHLNLPHLEYLVLSGNQISTIPSDLPPGLSMLCLIGNLITDIANLNNLTQLRTLHLCRNKIDDIPAALKLTSLEWVDLSENQIGSVDLHKMLEQFPELTYINLDKNPLDPDKVDELKEIAAEKRPGLKIIANDIGEQYRDGISIKGYPQALKPSNPST